MDARFKFICVLRKDIGGIMLFLSILLTVINTVGLIKTNKRAKNASCLKEDIV